MLKNIFVSKRVDTQKLVTLLINQVLFSFEMKKYASLAEINIILMAITKHSYCRLIVEICIIHLQSFIALIY